MAVSAPTLANALHPHRHLVAQTGRSLLCVDYRRGTLLRLVELDQTADQAYRSIRHPLRRQMQIVRLHCPRRLYPRKATQTFFANQRNGTLARFRQIIVPARLSRDSPISCVRSYYSSSKPQPGICFCNDVGGTGRRQIQRVFALDLERCSIVPVAAHHHPTHELVVRGPVSGVPGELATAGPDRPDPSDSDARIRRCHTHDRCRDCCVCLPSRSSR